MNDMSGPLAPADNTASSSPVAPAPGQPPAGGVKPSGLPPGSQKFNGTLGGLLKLPGGDKIVEAMLENLAIQICKEMDKREKKMVENRHKREKEEKKDN